MIAAAIEGRGERFAARTDGAVLPQFADDRRRRRWVRAAQTCGPRWPIVVGILASRRAIDAELAGLELARLAAAVGEPLFDAICAADVVDLALADDGPTPTPECAATIGRETIAGCTARCEALLDRAAAIVEHAA